MTQLATRQGAHSNRGKQIEPRHVARGNDGTKGTRLGSNHCLGGGETVLVLSRHIPFLHFHGKTLINESPGSLFRVRTVRDEHMNMNKMRYLIESDEEIMHFPIWKLFPEVENQKKNSMVTYPFIEQAKHK